VKIRHFCQTLVVAGLLVSAAPTPAQIPITGDPAPAAPAKPTSKPPEAAPATPDRRAGGNADAMLADVADTYKFAVGAVVVVIPKVGAVAFGTAWAFESNLFATNAHVVKAMEDIAQKAPDAPFYIAINQRPDKRLKITGFKRHPQYEKREIRFDGKEAIHSSFDIGVIRTSEAAPTHFNVATRGQLQSLRSGARVAFLGFPTESLEGGNLDTQMPIATMQSGIVTSLSDSFLGDSGFENNRLVRHNLPATGGASGSPIFTPDGVVVAILWGGNLQNSVVQKEEGKLAVERDPSAALVNFAARIDGLAGVPRP
jgi:V8-like Glu-specific endopeptidase